MRLMTEPLLSAFPAEESTEKENKAHIPDETMTKAVLFCDKCLARTHFLSLQVTLWY